MPIIQKKYIFNTRENPDKFTNDVFLATTCLDRRIPGVVRTSPTMGNNKAEPSGFDEKGLARLASCYGREQGSGLPLWR
jgi:hypothetical protein